jgi:hypothetical protein
MSKTSRVLAYYPGDRGSEAICRYFTDIKKAEKLHSRLIKFTKLIVRPIITI